MKKIIVTIALLIPILSFAQKKIDTYTASNGITYHLGDTVKLGRGSANNGDFLYLTMGGWGAVATYSTSAGSDQHNIGRAMSGMNVIIKKIQQASKKGATKTWFVVGGGNITNYNLMIEDAIVTCEIADCKKTP